ncbi:MAG: diaminopimelate epimerase [Lutibacter sp.]|jgi:diaminopimelate epimerase|nr:diaminopimelate epimerase [Lutibacter sp.]
MELPFYKYQGAGNDFIVIDNRDGHFPKKNDAGIRQLCDRRFGIGADGLILLENAKKHDFTMVYFNADGHEGSMCGNGGRCLVAFARDLGIIDKKGVFMAIDGEHLATIEKDTVCLKMGDVSEIQTGNQYYFLDTGSPHHVEFCEDVAAVDLARLGPKIRYGAPYLETGVNVNIAEQCADKHFKVRTYERGVEKETLACGTGVTAVAIAAHHSGLTTEQQIDIDTIGGRLSVSFKLEGAQYQEVFLTGPASLVFTGNISL